MTQFYEKPDSHYTPHGWMDYAKCGGLPIEWDSLTPQQQQGVCANCPVRVQCRQFMAASPHTPKRVRLEVGGICKRGHLINTADDLITRNRCKQCNRKTNVPDTRDDSDVKSRRFRIRVGGQCLKGLHTIDTADDIIFKPDGSRECRACVNARRRRAHARKMAERRAAADAKRKEKKEATRVA